MDNRKYNVFVARVVNGVPDIHLSKNKYSFDLSNRKGLTDWVILDTPGTNLIETLNLALQSEAVVALGESVVASITARIAKINADVLKEAMKGTVKRGRKPKEAKVEKVVLTDSDLNDIVASIVPSQETSDAE